MRSNSWLFCLGAVVAVGLAAVLNQFELGLLITYDMRLVWMVEMGCFFVVLFGERKEQTK